MSIYAVIRFLHGEVKSQLALNFGWSSSEQVGAKTEGSQCILTGSYKQRVTFEWDAGCDLSGFIDFDLEIHVALNSLRHRFVRIHRHGFVFDAPEHNSS